jgi:hypothetical protein
MITKLSSRELKFAISNTTYKMTIEHSHCPVSCQRIATKVDILFDKTCKETYHTYMLYTLTSKQSCCLLVRDWT